MTRSIWKALASITLAAACCAAAGDIAEAGKPSTREHFETRGEIVWEVPTDEKWIALTFDDGPDPVYTPQIANLLSEYGGKATFFVVGERTERYPNIAIQLAEQGHELANHTYKHKYFQSGTSEAAIEDEIRKAKEAIAALGKQGAPWFRPPGGYYNERIVAAAKRQGYTVVMWSWHQDTKDWKAPGVSRIVNKVLGNARNGDFVLFHDHGDGAQQTLQALRQILPELQKRGYRFVTVSELMNKKNNPA